MKNIDVIIADDHKLFRNGLRELVASMREINEIREAADGDQLLTLIKQRIPDLVILDLELPKVDGFEAAKFMATNHPSIKILVLTMYDNIDFINYLWEIGIHGYLLKSSGLEEMYKAISGVIENDFYKNDVLEKALKTRDSNMVFREIEKPTHLTTREKTVLSLLAEEKTSKEIGEDLGISNRTVEKIRNGLLRKFKKKSVVGLVKFAIQHKLIYL